MNGAEALLRTLAAGGIDICFANPGTSEMHIMDAGRHVPALRFVPCLFEGVATGAADGFARMTGKPAATLLHLGPGLANGLANLHNARKAGSPIVNIVGEHPAYHRGRETPLGSNVEAVARTFSHWLRTSQTVAGLPTDAADAVRAALAGRIATLAVPADVAWEQGALPAAIAPIETQGEDDAGPEPVDEALAMLKSDRPTALLLGGKALHGRGLALAAKIADASGSTLFSPYPLARLERGRGRPAVTRLPYVREQARALLEPFRQFILIGTTEPFAYFALPDDRAVLLPEGAERCALTGPDSDVVGILERLAGGLPRNDDVYPKRPDVPRMPSGALDPDTIAAAIAALLPEGAIVIDEGMTAGRGIMAACRASPPHDWLGNTGGSIGIAMPLAVGAAMAAKDRPVFCLSADGSGMYTPQALWTIAREGLAVTTVIFANNAYALLKHEYARISASPAESVLAQFDLVRPALDWVALAKSMGVPGRRVTTLDEFASALSAGFASSGPNLIEVPL
jgi:acetolactate synthase-1/2/3 large subunit